MSMGSNSGDGDVSKVYCPQGPQSFQGRLESFLSVNSPAGVPFRLRPDSLTATKAVAVQ